MAKLTNEEIQAKADELEKQLNSRIHPFAFPVENDPEDQVVGYLKELATIVKLRILDKISIGGFSAASEALDVCLIKEHSDPRITSMRPEDNEYYLGAIAEIYKTLKVAESTFKKK